MKPVSQPCPISPAISRRCLPNATPTISSSKARCRRELNGALYRIGPNPQFPPLGNSHHWFLGDGMVHALFIENGRVALSQSLGAHASVQRGARSRPPALWRVVRRRARPTRQSPARRATSPTPTSCRMPASCSRSMRAARRSRWIRRSLETAGSWTFNGDYRGPMTAHPKIDAETGEMFFFGYMAAGPVRPTSRSTSSTRKAT